MHKSWILLVVVALLLIAAGTVSAQEADSAFVRFGHFSVDADEVDVYVDGEVAVEGLDFPDVSDWMEVSAGTYSVAVAPAGEAIGEAILGPTDYELAAGDWVTVAVIGDVEHETLAAQVLTEDYSDIGQGETRLSVFHAILAGPPVNVMVNDTELVHGLGYPGYFGPESDGFVTSDIVARAYDVKITLDDGTTVLDLGELLLGAGRGYFVALAGAPTDPTFVVVTTDPDDLTAMEAATPEAADLGTGTLHARIAHLAPGTGDVDIYIGDKLAESEFTFPNITDWSEMDAGVYHVAVVPAGEAVDEAVLEADVPLATDSWVTIAVIGSLEAESLAVQPVVEDYSPIGAGETRVGVFNSIVDSQFLNVVVNDTVLVQSLSYPGLFDPESDGYASSDIVAGTHTLQITLTDGTVVVDVGELRLGARRNYFVAATGTMSNPTFVLVGTDPADVE